jgi:peptide/nickel transport system permease protein
MSRSARLLGTGFALVGGLALTCVLGPPLLPRPPAPDPVHGALLPPFTRVEVVHLDDGAVRIVRPGDTAPEPDAEDDSTRRVSRHLFLLGSDRYGRDLLLLLLRGGRLSLAIAGLGAAVSLFLGTLVGMLAATAGRWGDAVLMRTVDALLAFPVLFLMILVAALVRPSPALLAVVLGLTAWMGLARIVRGQVLSLRERQWVLAGRAAGSRWHRIWTLHIAPHLVAPVSQDTALRLGDLVIAEATLSFLGLGVPPTVPTWGSLIADGQRIMPSGWWLAVFPGVAIAALVIGFALIGDGLSLKSRPDDVLLP